MTIWYDILFAVNTVSKNLQLKDMHIDVAIDQLKGLISYFKTYRENGFASAMISSKEIATIIEIEYIFHEKHVSRRKKQLMRMLMTRQHNLLKNLLELITSYI
jgi:hypothetical protein